MQWKIINGWHCVTAGDVSWKFQSLRDAVEWAFTTREARAVELAMGK